MPDEPNANQKPILIWRQSHAPSILPEETPALKQAVAYAHKTHAAASALIIPALEATAVVKKLKKALRTLTGPELAVERKALRTALAQAESMAIQLNVLLTQAQAIYERAWAKRCAILDAQRREWEQANPELTSHMLKRQLNQANRDRQDRRTRKAQLIKRALSA